MVLGQKISIIFKEYQNQTIKGKVKSKKGIIGTSHWIPVDEGPRITVPSLSILALSPGTTIARDTAHIQPRYMHLPRGRHGPRADHRYLPRQWQLHFIKFCQQQAAAQHNTSKITILFIAARDIFFSFVVLYLSQTFRLAGCPNVC